MQTRLAEVIYNFSLSSLWYGMVAVPNVVMSVITVTCYEVPARAYREANIIMAVLNFFVIAIEVWLVYAVICFFVLKWKMAIRSNNIWLRNFFTVMRELPYEIRNVVFFWARPVVLCGIETGLTAKYAPNGDIQVFLNGRLISETKPVGTTHKEMAFASSTSKKVTDLSNFMVRSSVCFYYKADNAYSFVGMGSVVKIKGVDGCQRLYLVTAAHVADASTHFSAAATHGSSGQRFVLLGEAVVKSPYTKEDDVDIAAYEVSQSQLSGASLSTYPSLKPAETCSISDGAYITDAEILECMGYGDPFSEEKGFFRSHGPAVDSPVSNPMIGGHQASTRKGWSGCGLYMRKGQKTYLAGVHTGAHGQTNTFVLMEELNEFLRDDLIVKEREGSGTRKSRKFGGGEGRQSSNAKGARSFRAMYIAGTNQPDTYNYRGRLENAASVDDILTVKKLIEEDSAERSAPKVEEKPMAERRKDLSSAMQAFVSPVKKPQTGLPAVMTKESPKQSENPKAEVAKANEPTPAPPAKEKDLEKAILQPVPIIVPTQPQSLGVTEVTTLVTALGQSILKDLRKEIKESVSSSQSSSPTSTTSSTSQASPKMPSSEVSASTTTKPSTQESQFQEVVGKQRKKLLQKVTSQLASNGCSQSAMDSMKALSSTCLKEVLKCFSPQSTASPPQGTPTASTSDQTDSSSTKQKKKSKKKSGNASSESTSTKTTSTATSNKEQGSNGSVKA